MRLLSLFLKLLLCVLPWSLRRPLLNRCFGYQIHPHARIRLSWVYPKALKMESGSRIGPFVVAVNLDRMVIGEQASIGRRTWITGFPTGTASQHFAHEQDRRSELRLGKHSAVTKNHHLDCTNVISIGDFVTIAGYHSQFLTHSIDIQSSRQCSRPITVGDHCFVGTKSVLLGGSVLPDRCVLGACSLLNKPHQQEYRLYGGVPAKPVSELPSDAAYFHRDVGFVV